MQRSVGRHDAGWHHGGNVRGLGEHSKQDFVEFVTAFTGQAFRLDAAIRAEPVLVVPAGSVLLLPEVAFEFSERTPRIAAVGLLQGAIVFHGRGRVAVFGEAAMFTAQLAGPERRPVGMNAPEARENHRFALNVVHWLSGTLP